MKLRKVSALAIGVSMSAVLIPSTVMALTTDNYLVREMAGDDVYDLQSALSQLGYLNVDADGVFGSFTEDAVRRYQQDNGLYVDGEAGPQVLALLNESYVPVVPAESSIVDPVVNDNSDAENTADGSGEAGSGAESAAAASSYDFSNSLLAYGDNGDMVTALQQALIELGYLKVAADGIFGAYTDEAVRAFQRDIGLYADGLAGPKTLGALPIKYSGAPAQSSAQNAQSSTEGAGS